MKRSFDIALLTDPRYTAETAGAGDWYFENILHEDRLLAEALSARGVTATRVEWSDPRCDWSQFRIAVFRTTWDYFDRFGEFTAWLDRIERLTQLCNPAALVRWNWDKHYLADLDACGVPIVPTRFLERGSTLELAAIMTEAHLDEAVIKPCVSGGARHTYRVTPGNAAEIDALVQPLLASEAFLVQPFERGIVEAGEDSLMVFDGRYSHAVRKNAKAGDFRVQDDHGGTVRAYEPCAAQVAVAERAVAAVAPLPAYARVDMVERSPGEFAVMELELIEPELWMRFYPAAADALAEAIVAQL